MAFPLWCTGEIRIATEDPAMAILDRVERALRTRGIRQIQRDGHTLSFSDVSFDRPSFDLFVPINAGRIAVVDQENGEVAVSYRVSLVRAFLITTAIWPVFGMLVLTNTGPALDAYFLLCMWGLANVIMYLSTAHRFPEFLRQTAYRHYSNC